MVTYVLEKPDEDRPGGGSCSVSQAPKEKASMKESKFPKGWDEARVKKALASYEGQMAEQTVAEDEAGVESSER